MSSFTPIQLNSAFVEALSDKTAYCDDDARMIQVRPPEQNDGLDASKDLLRAFHDYEEVQEGLLGRKNASDISGFELWYDKQELQFNYYVESREREQHFRQQIDGHFSGCDIDAKRERFVSVSEGDYAAGGEVWLTNHYFEPIRNENAVEEWDDPYLLLFSELDTRDDTRTMLQILFRPAEDDWTRTMFENVDDYAEGLRDDKTESKLFGLIKNTRSATEDETEYAGAITRQAGRPAFYVNIRYVVIGETAEDAATHADNIATRLAVGYKEVSGQTLKTYPAETPEEVSDLLRKTAAREPVHMDGRRGIWEDFKRAKFGDPTKRMIMTIPEMAGLMHLPKSKEVNLDAIDWTDIPVEGSLPHNAKQFHRIDEDTRRQQLARWVVEQRDLLDELGLDERAMRLVSGNPRDEELVERILAQADGKQSSAPTAASSKSEDEDETTTDGDGNATTPDTE